MGELNDRLIAKRIHARKDEDRTLEARVLQRVGPAEHGVAVALLAIEWRANR